MVFIIKIIVLCLKFVTDDIILFLFAVSKQPKKT